MTASTTLNIDTSNNFNHACERITPADHSSRSFQRSISAMRLPSRRYLLQLFPPARIAVFLIGAIVLTFLSSLIPRPVYGPGEQTIRFGYPMPYLNLTLEPAANSAGVVFVSWWGATVHLELSLALLNVAFFLMAFALFSAMFRPTRRINPEP
jgi:hypothetical protein